jgi:hypothetical protein
MRTIKTTTAPQPVSSCRNIRFLLLALSGLTATASSRFRTLSGLVEENAET